MSNEELLDNVKSWISLDNDIRSLQKAIKIKRKEKKSRSNKNGEVLLPVFLPIYHPHECYVG